MTIRTYVYNLFRNDPVLRGLGYDEEGLYANFAPDAPVKDRERFLVLRWSTEGARFGRDTTVHPRDLTVWAYDVQSDFSSIDKALQRVCRLIRASEGQPHGSGWINGIVDNGGSEDLAASEYGRSAVSRNWGFTINASEEGS